MLYNVGHFVSVDDGTALFALPNAFHVQMAEPHREEVAAALSEHFGTPVAVRLVASDRSDDRDLPAGSSGRDLPADSSSAAPAELSSAAPESLDDVGDPIDDDAAIVAGAEWATDRLRAAFPGAEELSP